MAAAAEGCSAVTMRGVLAASVGSLTQLLSLDWVAATAQALSRCAQLEATVAERDEGAAEAAAAKAEQGRLAREARQLQTQARPSTAQHPHCRHYRPAHALSPH